MVCLAEDLQALIASGALEEALQRLNELMESYHHRPTSRWRDAMLADIFQQALRRRNVSVAVQILDLTLDAEILQARRGWVSTIFGDVFTLVAPAETLMLPSS